MLGIRPRVCRASALRRRAWHDQPAPPDRGSCHSLCRDALSNRVLRESHSRRHVRSGYMLRRNWSARVIRGRSRGYCGRARRSEPRSMGAVVAGRPTSGMARDRRSEARQDRSFSPVAFFFFFGARIPGKTAPASTEGDTSHKNAARSHKPDGATSFPTSCEAHKSYHPEICDRVTPRP